MAIKAVIFDLGNTLVAYYKPQDFFQVLEKSVLGLCDYLSANDHVFQPREIFGIAKAFNYERDDLTIFPLEKRLQEIFQLEDGFLHNHQHNLSRVFLAPIFATARPDPQAVPLLVELKNRGYLTALVSNTPWGSPSEPWKQEVTRHGLTGYLNEVVFCVDAGRRKPHRLIFEYTLKSLNINANEAVFVGDDQKWDIYGARQAGIRPILLCPNTRPDNHGLTTIAGLSDLLLHL